VKGKQLKGVMDHEHERQGRKTKIKKGTFIEGGRRYA
jgi:hypothetical protein